MKIMEIFTWQARHEKNVTLIQLARMTGISKSTLNAIENGQLSPRLDHLEAIAKALNVHINDLYNSPYK